MTYLIENDLEEEARVVITSRDSVKLVMDVEELKRIVLNNNRDKKRIEDVFVYVTDSLGLTTKSKSETITKKLRSNRITRLKKQKEENKEIYKLQKLKKKKFKKAKYQARKEKFKAKVLNIKMRLKRKAKPDKNK